MEAEGWRTRTVEARGPRTEARGPRMEPAGSARGEAGLGAQSYKVPKKLHILGFMWTLHFLNEARQGLRLLSVTHQGERGGTRKSDREGSLACPAGGRSLVVCGQEGDSRLPAVEGQGWAGLRQAQFYLRPQVSREAVWPWPSDLASLCRPFLRRG